MALENKENKQYREYKENKENKYKDNKEHRDRKDDKRYFKSGGNSNSKAKPPSIENLQASKNSKIDTVNLAQKRIITSGLFQKAPVNKNIIDSRKIAQLVSFS